MNIGNPTVLILFGMFVGSLGPVIVILGNVTQIWKKVSDGTKYDGILETKHKLAQERSISKEDPAFDVVLDLLDTDSISEEEITKIRIDSSGWGEMAGHVRVMDDPQDFESSEPLNYAYGLMVDIDDELEKIKDHGEHRVLYVGMALLIAGFIIQSFGVALRSSII